MERPQVENYWITNLKEQLLLKLLQTHLFEIAVSHKLTSFSHAITGNRNYKRNNSQKHKMQNHHAPLQFLKLCFHHWSSFIAQKMKFSIKDFFSKCEQIRRKLWVWSHLLKKSLLENLIFCAVFLKYL